MSLWDQLILNPMTNALLYLYGVLGDNFFLSIAVFTVLTRLLTLPLNIKQQRTTMRMQELQPQIQEIQKKYRDNPQKMQEEFAKIGYNPAEQLAGCLPLLLTLPIFLGLYQAIQFVLGNTPRALFELQQRVYPFIDLTELLPVSNTFLWFNLGQPDPFFVLPVLVFATMWFSQKLVSPTAAKRNDKDKKGQEDNPMASMTQSMQYTMPIMFGLFSLQFPAGLSLYFVISNLIGIGQGMLMRRAAETAEEKQVAARASINGEPAPSSADRQIAAKSQDSRVKESAGKAKKKRASKSKRRSKSG